MKRSVLLFLVIALSASSAWAEVVTKNVEYKDGGVTLKGFLAYDDAVTGKQPGVLVVHEWWGLNEFVKTKAQELAKLGYLALAVDMYGDGKTTSDQHEASRLSGELSSSAAMRERAQVGLKVLMDQPRVDKDRLAAIGFCFGGTTALELAYGGAPLKGVVSFHGGMPSPKEADLSHINASILVLHGANDGFVSKEKVDSFVEAMKKGQEKWELIQYGGAKHGFMNPFADKANIDGLGYNPDVAKRAWSEMERFLAEKFS